MSYALKGARTGQLATWNGKVIVHPNRDELAFLFPNMEPVYVQVSDEESMPLWAHPDMAPIHFPIRKSDFRG